MAAYIQVPPNVSSLSSSRGGCATLAEPLMPSDGPGNEATGLMVLSAKEMTSLGARVAHSKSPFHFLRRTFGIQFIPKTRKK